jgi:hypothetical protein
MTMLLVLAVLLPWSIWRQMHAHEITRESLLKLPLIFAAVGVLATGTRDLPGDAAAVAYVLGSLVLSIAFGVWRGWRISIWRDADGRPISRGNRTTITLWVALIASKIALGTVASITGIFPGDHAGEIFLFLAFSFAAQNLIVARRTRITEAGPVPQAAAAAS